MMSVGSYPGVGESHRVGGSLRTPRSKVAEGVRAARREALLGPCLVEVRTRNFEVSADLLLEHTRGSLKIPRGHGIILARRARRGIYDASGRFSIGTIQPSSYESDAVREARRGHVVKQLWTKDG